MKNLLIILASILGLSACNPADEKKDPVPLTEEQKAVATSDTANFTSIEWLDSTYTDLGKIKEGQVVEISYRFRNSGTKNLIITNVSAGCGCTIPEKPEEPIAPGQEGTIKAKFDSKNRKGENRKDVFVQANTNPRDMTLTFRVEVTD
jgi:hypothetical protein